MPFHFSQGASDRPKQTIHAAEVLHDNARSIASVCMDAAEDEVVVAVINRDMGFGGVWTIPRSELSDRVPQLDDGGWSLVFGPGTPAADIEDRCLRLARLAFARWEVMRRWASRHA